MVVALLVATLSGCGTLTGQGTVVPSLTPEPAVTQARATGLTEPARPFAGKCSALMSDSEASGVLGSEVFLHDAYFGYAPEVSAELHAGLQCRWESVDGSYDTVLSVVLLPEGAASYDPPVGCHPGDEYMMAYCPVEAIANGTRVSGALRLPSTIEVMESTTAAFIALFEERATAAQPAPVLVPAIGAWAHPVDCAAVVAAGDFSSVPGLGAGSVGTEFPYGAHDYALPAEDALENGSAEEPWCWIDGEDADVLFVAMGGGRWLEDTVLDTGGILSTLDGYERAYESAGEDGMTQVDVFDGPNWLHIEVRYMKNAKSLADALFAALNTTAAS